MSKFYSEEQNRYVTEGVSKNMFSFIDEATKDIEDKVAYTYYGREVTYKEWKENVMVYANNLLKFGLKQGDAFTLVMPNTLEFSYYWYAAMVLGIKLIPFDPRTNPEAIKDGSNKCNSKLLIVILDKYKEKISPILDELKVEKVVVSSPTDLMGDSIKAVLADKIYRGKELILNIMDKDFASDRIVLNKDFINNSLTTPIKPVYEEGLEAAYLFTSGSEGKAKVAVHTHDNYNIKAKQIEIALPLGVPGDKFLGIIPFFSAYGSFQGMHNSLYRGLNVILVPKFTPKDVPELICKYQPQATIAVPNYYHDLYNRYERLLKKYKLQDLSFAKYLIAGGDKQSSTDVRNCIDKFGIMNRGYGATELGGATAFTAEGTKYEDYSYTGIPFPGVEVAFELDPESGNTELLVSDPAMMTGYLGEDEINSKIFTEIDGRKYLRTGDFFTQDELERLHFIDRKKRAMMRPDGHTVHATPIEEAIDSNPLVEKSCVVGLKPAKLPSGTIPTAFVVLKEGIERGEKTAHLIDETCLEKLSERNRALAYVFVDEIPQTLMGKSDFKKLSQLKLEDLPYYLVDTAFADKISSKDKSFIQKVMKK